uniref:Immunoglobulin V-set domain-containing protein n=1 Tax=Dicentrarchus labrax TaxID=13489 RepID=A0A8P4KNR9_DICLA
TSAEETFYLNRLLTVGSGKRAESGRITLVDLGNGAFTVTFSQLQMSDSGRYWCGVDRPGFDTFTAVHVIQLNVSRGTVCHVTAQDHLFIIVCSSFCRCT